MPILSADAVVIPRGIAHETLATAGWTRLLGILALDGAPGDVETEMLTTTIRPRRRSDLGRVEAWLAAPHVREHDLARVRRRLAGEPVRADAMSAALRVRFGARGPGLLGFGGTGLGSATPDRLQRAVAGWADDAPPLPRVVRGEPRGYAWGAERTVMSGVVPAASLAGLGDELVRALQEEVGGHGPDRPRWESVPVDAERAVLLVHGWATRERAAPWRDLLAAIEADGARDFADTLLVGAHPKVLDFVLGVIELGAPHARGDGTGRLRRGAADGLRLQVDPRGVLLDNGYAGWHFPAADLAAVLVHPGGSRTLVDVRGYTTVVDPGEWSDGDGAIAEIDALAGAERLLPQLGDPEPDRRQRLPWMPGPRVVIGLLGLAALLLIGFLVGVAALLARLDVPEVPVALVGGVAALAAGLTLRARSGRPPGAP